MHKKRILMCAESSHIDSGFGNYTKSILSRLYASNKYEIAELSAYRNASTPKTEPWKIYPNAPTDKDTLEKFATNPANTFGAWGFERACLDFKPDIVFDVRDYWMSNFVELSAVRPYVHWFLAPTIDSAPQKNQWLQTFSNADTLSAHTQWGIDYLASTGMKVNLVEPVNDAVDTDKFNIGQAKETHKKTLGLPIDSYVIGSIMRNQKRKLIPNLIKIMSQISKETPKAVLYLHSSYPDLNGWDIPKLLIEYDVYDKVYFSYRCQKCKKFFASKFIEIPAGCKHCNNNTASLCSVANGLSDTELSYVINSFDIYVQYAICEGFGIPPVEAAACGVPVITIDHGAMREVGDNIGADIVPVAAMFRELETDADRVNPDDNYCANLLIQKYNEYQKMSFVDKMKQAETVREKLINAYSWDKTAAAFERIFDNIELTGKQGKWDSAPQMPQPEVKVPPLPSKRQVINFIIDHVVNYPELKNVGNIQDVIKCLDLGYINHNGKVQKFDMPEALKSFENIMHARGFWEQARIGNAKMPEITKYVVEY